MFPKKLLPLASELQESDRMQIGFFLFLATAAVVVSGAIATKSYFFIFVPLGLAVFWYLYSRKFEAFMLLLIFMNHEFFWLLPRDILGKYRFQGFLYPIFLLTGLWYFLQKKKRREVRFDVLVLTFFLMVIGSAMNSHLQGQPLWLALKGEIGYYIFLYYFVFLGKGFDVNKLYKLFMIAGIGLCLINNLQYAFFQDYRLMYVRRQYERVGHLRFLVGDFFLILTAFIMLGEYFRKKKKIYLLGFIYVTGTVIIQMQIRATIFGFLVTTLALFILARRPNMIKMAVVGVALLAFLVIIAPVFRGTPVGDLVELTKYEVFEGKGNVLPRYIAYNYYFKEIMKSPIIGRGIWNVQFLDEANPDNLENKGIYLEDIGIVSVAFHFGMVGVIWLILLFRKTYRLTFQEFGKLKKDIFIAPVGYLIFSLATTPTYNAFITGENIIYLALILAIITRTHLSDPEKPSHEKTATI